MKGFTLLEVLITMGISVAVGALLVVIIVNTIGISTKESSKLSEGLNINDALYQVRNNIKNSSGVAVSYIDGSTTYTSSVTQLVLKIASIDASNNFIANTYDYFVFFLDQNKLRFKTFPNVLSSRKAQNQIFSTLVDSLKFQYLNSANPPLEVTPSSALKVRMSITLKQKTGANFETTTATSEANLRND